jgi:hypothetical protein
MKGNYIVGRGKFILFGSLFSIIIALLYYALLFPHIIIEREFDINSGRMRGYSYSLLSKEPFKIESPIEIGFQNIGFKAALPEKWVIGNYEIGNYFCEKTVVYDIGKFYTQAFSHALAYKDVEIRNEMLLKIRSASPEEIRKICLDNKW